MFESPSRVILSKANTECSVVVLAECSNRDSWGFTFQDPTIEYSQERVIRSILQGRGRDKRGPTFASTELEHTLLVLAPPPTNSLAPLASSRLSRVVYHSLVHLPAWQLAGKGCKVRRERRRGVIAWQRGRHHEAVGAGWDSRVLTYRQTVSLEADLTRQAKPGVRDVSARFPMNPSQTLLKLGFCLLVVLSQEGKQSHVVPIADLMSSRVLLNRREFCRVNPTNDIPTQRSRVELLHGRHVSSVRARDR